MKMRSKKLITLFLSMAMILQLAGCGSSAEQAEENDAAVETEESTEAVTEEAAEEVTTEATEEEPVTITIWHQSVADTDPVKRIIEESVEEYHKLHPNVTIVQDGVTGEQYKTKIKTAFAAGEAPDIAYMFGGGSFVKPYLDAGYLLPIDKYLTEDTKSKILDGMLENCKYDGKTYTLPTITFLANLYCNTEMFEAAGAKYPTNWTELLDAVDKLKAAGYTPIVLGEKDRWPGMYWYDIMSARQAGNDTLNEAFKDTSKFNTQPFVDAAAKMQDLVKAGAFNESMMSMSYTEMIDGFAAGQGAMIYQANWIHPSFEDAEAATNGKVKAIAFPVFEDGKGTITEFSGGGTDGYYVNANTEHPKEAIEYLCYLSERIGIEGYLDGAGLACWNLDGVDTSAISPLSQDSTELMASGTSYITWWDNILPADSSETYKDLVAELLALKITPEEFAEKMSKLAPTDLN
ncbi:MAG: extracellular solute-binding protein [Lachnospiraceae bacterium]|nr:extracellular solute-binding protein [Lachnospiraceae bacterium]